MRPRRMLGCGYAVMRVDLRLTAEHHTGDDDSAKSHPALVSGSHAPHFLPLSSLSHCSSSNQIFLTRNKMEYTHIAQGMSVDRGASSAGTMNTAERNRTHEKIVRNVFISVNF